LVEQTLDPMVSAYFKNVAQTRTLIQLLQDRAEIQDQSSVEMRGRFDRYNLELQEVLIGTPTEGRGGSKLEEILTQLRSRQVAMEQVETYRRQEDAAVQERELREAEARARQQQSITESELSIAILANQGKADLARAQQQAAQIQALAGAEAEKVRLLGVGEASRVAALAGAEAERAARVGIAQAMAIEEQVRAYGGPRYQLTQQVMARFAEAVEKSGVDIVPRVVIGGRGDGGNGSGDGSTGSGMTGGGTILESLLALLLSERAGVDVAGATEPSPAAAAVRAELQRRLGSGGSDVAA
ncbi:MAG TPA: flotillin family protein, partial [Verrucomicrobiae bacterium]|nr:flotillin family protein [Verrucomicrobiae bacterium]